MIIVCGLPGTGKTTLCKKFEEEQNYKYISDWDIFKQHNIKVNELQNKFEISSRYSNLIIDYLRDKNEKIVLDLEYSISPDDFVNSELAKYAHIIYLGFMSVDENKLFDLFRSNSNNQDVKDVDLKDKIKFYKQMSKDYCYRCKELDLDFIDINRNKNELLQEVFNKMSSL